MNLANKITMSRIYLTVLILIVLMFPFSQIGITVPTYTINGVFIDIRYVISGIIFIIASLTDYFDGKVARKYNLITDYGKVIDAISDKLLTNSILIVLACNGMISSIIPLVIIMRDIVVDSLKMLIGNKSKAVAAIGVAKWKTATLMVGIVLTLFYNLPFEFISLRVSDFLLIIACVLSVISGIEYYNMAKVYMQDK